MANDLSIPSYGVNYSPVKPFLSMQSGQTPQPHKVIDCLKERFSHFNELDKVVWREIYAVGQLVGLFREGKQLLARNPYGGGYRVLPIKREDESTRRAMNMMQFYAINQVKTWMMSKPDIVTRPGSDTDKSVMAAKGCGIIVDHYERQFYTPWFNEQEGLLASQFGTYINRFRFDEGAKGLTVIKQIVEQKQVSFGQGYGYCGECNHYGASQEFESPNEDIAEGGEQSEQPSYACPQCQNPYPQVQPAASGMLNQATGTQEVKIGDLICEQLPLPSCKWDLSKRAEESSWFLHQQRVNIGAIRRLIGNVKPKGNPDDAGLDIMEALAKSGQAVFGSSAGGDRKQNTNQDLVKVEEMYLSPDDYSDVVISQDEETVSGGMLPKGKLTDTFPDGLVAVGLNGMTTVLGLYQESHKQQIVSGVWHMRPLSGVGRGDVDSVEVQKRFNNMDSQQVAFMSSTATPAWLYDPNIITEDDSRYLGSPKQNIPVDLTMLPQGTKLADAVHGLMPGTMPAQFVQYTQEFLNHMFQFSSLVMDFSGGLPGVDNKTATGANIAAALSASLFNPLLQIKGSVRQKAAEISVELYRKHIPIAKYFPLKGKYGREQGIMLSTADLDADVIFELVPDSETPKNSFTKRQDAQEFFVQLFGGVPNFIAAKAQAPEDIEEISRIYNMQLETDSFDYVGQICRQRFDQMKSVVQMVTDPRILVQQIQPPISVYESQQEQKISWWKDVLDTDEGLEAPMQLRQAVELVDVHTAFVTGQQAAVAGLQGVVAVAGNAAPNAVQEGQNQDQQNQQNATEDQRTEAEAERSSQDAEDAHKRDMEKTGAQHAHETGIAHMNNQAQAKMAQKRAAA